MDEKVDLMSQIAEFVYEEENVEIEAMVDERVTQHLADLRKQAEQRLTRRRKLSARELQQMLPSDEELFPIKDREQMIEESWREECANAYLLQNEHGKFDQYIEEMMSLSRERTPMHMEQKLIERNFRRLALSGNPKFRQLVMDQCLRLLDFHGSAYYPMELMLMINEEDDMQFDDILLNSIEKRLIHAHPFEGISMIRIAMRLFDTVDEHTIQASAGATREHNILDDIELLLNKGLVLSPSYITGWLVLGRVNLMRAKYLRVLECVNQAQINLTHREDNFHSKLEKFKIDIKLLQADAYRKMPRQQRRAEEIYKEVVEQDRTNTIALKGLAHVASHNGHTQAAERIWEKVLELNPSDHDACSELSWLQYGRRDLQSALKFALRANEITESSPSYLYRHRLARIYWELGDEYRRDKQYCHSLLLQSAKLKPDFATNFTYLGHYYAEVERDQDRSIKCYRKAIALDPMEEEAGNALGDIYERNKLFTLAISLYRDASSRSTRAKWAWKRLGFYEQSNGRLDEALIAFQHALRFDSSDSMCWLGYAETMSRQGKFLASVKAYSKAYELDNSLTYALCQMAYIKSLLSDLTEAAQLFEQTILADSSLLTAYTGLADVLRSMASIDFEDGLFVDAAFKLMKAHLLLWSRGDDLQKFRAPWKQLGDIQCFFYLLPDSAVHAAHTKIHAAELSGAYGIGNELKLKLPNEKLQYVQMAKRSFQLALDRTAAKSEKMASAYFDLGIACYYCKELSSASAVAAQSEEKDALTAFRQALTIDPRNALFWNAMGCAYGDLRRKQHCFIKAIQYNDKFHVAWNNLGVMYLQQGRFGLAQQAFINAQNLLPTDCVPFIGLAMLNEKMGAKRALEKAQEGFAHAVSLENNALANIGLGYTAFINSQFQISSTAMFKYLQFYDNDPDAYNLLGLALEAQGKYVEAEEVLRTCCLLLEQKDGMMKQDACDGADRGLVIHESSIVFRGHKSMSSNAELTLARVNYARVLRVLERYSEAYDLYANHILPHVPLVNEAAVKIDMALCCFHMKKLEESFRLLKESIQCSVHAVDSTRTEQAMLLQAKLQYHVGDKDATNRLLINCMKTFPQSLQIHLAYAAFSALTISDPNVALKVMQRINDKITFGTDREALTLQSNIYLINGNVTGARNTISKLIHLFPERHDLWDKLASLSTFAEQRSTTQGKFMPVNISQLCAQLLGPSIAHFTMYYFDNDPVKLIDRLYNIASLYNAMGIAPNYHGAKLALQYSIRMAQKVLRLDPTHDEARRLVASCLHSIAALEKQRHLFDASAVVLQQYISLSSADGVDTKAKTDIVPLMIALIEDRASSMNIEDATKIIRDAMQMVNGANADMESTLFAVLGRCVHARGDAEDKVLKCFENAIKKSPLNMYTWFCMTDMLIQQGRFRVAEACLLTVERIITAAAEIDPASVPANARFTICTYLAFVYYRIGIVNQGIKYARAAVKEYNASPVAMLLLGMLMLIKGDTAKAESSLQKAMHLAPDLPLANLSQYKVHYAREEWAEAEQCLWREKDLQPHSSFVLHSLGVFAFESGVPESALTLVQKAIRLDPTNKLYWHTLRDIRQTLSPAVEGRGAKKKK